MQLLTPLCVFQLLLRDLRQISTECFVKLAVVCDFCGVNMLLPLALQVPELDWIVQGVISSCLFSHTNAGQLG